MKEPSFRFPFAVMRYRFKLLVWTLPHAKPTLNAAYAVPRWYGVKPIPWTCCVGDPAQDCCRMALEVGWWGSCETVLSSLLEIQQMGYSVLVCFSGIFYLQMCFFMFFFSSCLFNVKFSLQSFSPQLVLFSFLLQLMEVSGVACRKKKSNLRLLFYTSKGY